MKLPKKIAELRVKNGLTQVQAARQMAGKGFPINASTLARWESGTRNMSVEQFFALCELYHVDDIKQTFTGAPGLAEDLLDGLNYTGRQHAKKLINLLRGDDMFTATEPVRKQHRYLKLFDLPASAGLGSYLDGDSYEEIVVDGTVPESAGFAVRVSGDSMKPRFVDGQIVFVREQQHLDVGDIGIFILDNEGLIKKWGGDRLISLNPEYKPVKLMEWHDLRISGKVVG